MRVAATITILSTSLFMARAEAQCIGWEQKQSTSHPHWLLVLVKFDGLA